MNALKLITSHRLPVPAPVIGKNGSIVWGWSLSLTERRADRDACIRAKRIDEELLATILDQRNAKTNARRID